MGLFGDASLHLLLDPGYWRPRIERLAERPRQLVIFPRPDLERPGIEVLELRLRAHDGERLSALLARSSFALNGESVRLRPCQELSSGQLAWREVESGQTDLIFRYPGDPGTRRLEDRVLDVLRVIQAACSIESVDCGKIDFPDSSEHPVPPENDHLAVRGVATGDVTLDLGEAPRSQDMGSDPRKKGLPDEFAIAMFFRSRGWI